MVQVTLVYGYLLANHRGNKSPDTKSTVSKRRGDRVVFVWLLRPTTSLLSEKTGMVGGVFSPL